MENPTKIKAALHRACTENVDRSIAVITQNLARIDTSRSSETKSSAGDKFETGRAMLHLEEQNNQRQLAEILQVRHELGRIDPSHSPERVQAGSLVTTDRGIYYLAVGLGKVTVNKQMYYCVSLASPVGKALLNHKVGDEVSFNDINTEVLKIF